MEEKGKRRDWVKNAAIILLAGLLVLTFFSNTIMNRNLPEVATQNIMSGSINAQVRGSGTVSANGTHVVKADQTREIRAVMVKNGQTVEAGDVLFVLGSGDSAELQQAQEQLYQLQLNYQRTALSGSSTDYTADELRVQNALDAYEEAETVVAHLEANLYEDSDRYQALQRQLEKATAERDAAKEAYDALIGEAQSNLSAAEAERLGAEQAIYLAEGWDVNEKDPTQLQIQKDYLDHPEKRISELEAEASGASDPGTDGEASEGSSAETAEKLEKWRTYLEKKNAVDDAQSALNAVSSAGLEAAQQKVDEIQEEMSQFNTSPEYQEAVAARDAAYLNYLDLQAALDARKNADARANANVGLELRELNRQIEEQKKKIEELSGGTENQITANVSGTILSIECTAGDTVAKDGILCTIEVPDMGYTMSFSVPNAQASRLRIGDTATVSNTYWGSQITATLESIRVDPKNPQTNKLLTFDVSGDVTAGMDLTISVGQRSANYDMIVPKSALHNDSTGYYVFKVESRNSPLGNRYIARRVTVEILAEDDNNVAVAGELYWGDYVITTSSAPIKNGDMVRLAD